MAINTTPKWDKVRKYISSWFGWGKKPSRKDALEGMEEFLESVKQENLVLDEEMLDALQTDK